MKLCYCILIIILGCLLSCGNAGDETKDTQSINWKTLSDSIYDRTTTPSTYTADQVIYVANAKSPTCINQKTTPSWSAKYNGNGEWTVVKNCILRSGISLSTDKWIFHEGTGKLIKK